MADRNDYLPGIVAWSAYLGIFLFVYWDAVVCVWRDPTAAGWAQGVGTLAAVGIAVGTYIHKLADDRRRETNERLRQAIAVALAIYPALNEIGGRLAVIQRRYEKLSAEELDTPIGTLKGGLFPDIDIAPSILRNADRLHVVGPNLIQSIALIETIDRLVDMAVKKGAGFTPRMLKEYVDKLAVALPRAKDEAAYYYDLPYVQDGD